MSIAWGRTVNFMVRRISSEILLFIYEEQGGSGEQRQVEEQERDAGEDRGLPGSDGPDHAAGLGEREGGDKFPGSAGDVVRGEKGVAQVGHGHDEIVGKARHIRVVPGEKGHDDSHGREDRTVQEEDEEGEQVKMKSCPDW